MDFMSLYHKLPTCLQNIAISCYGYKRERNRYGGSFKKHYAEAERAEFFSDKEIKEYQRKMLHELLCEAKKSEHYAKIFDKLGIDAEKEDAFDVLSKLPILQKDELRGNEESFYTDKLKDDQIFHTSGSTGTPLNIRMRLDDFKIRMAALERMKKHYGVSHKSRHISFVGKTIANKKNDIPWRRNVFGNQLMMSVYSLNNENKYKYIEKIKSYSPEMIEGYPSAVDVIAKWFLEEKIRLKLKCVLVTAETLSDEQKEHIEKAFLCPVVNYYGSSEGSPMITPCENAKFHVNFDTGIIEFLNEDGNPAKEGDLANMIVTSFCSKAMPLIRYNIGDMAVLDKRCMCGRGCETIREIIGRCDDIFYTEEKGYVGRMSTTLKLLPSFVQRAQIQQHSPKYFKLLLETADALNNDDKKKLLSDMRDKLGNVDINIEYTKRIDVGSNGKFRSQIRLDK